MPSANPLEFEENQSHRRAFVIRSISAMHDRRQLYYHTAQKGGGKYPRLDAFYNRMLMIKPNSELAL